MRVKTLRLMDFKRFNDLTIDLQARPSKIVALVGPNGSGKSSVFDAFVMLRARHIGSPGVEAGYWKKTIFTSGADSSIDSNKLINFASDEGMLGSNSFYIRSPYRYTSRIRAEAVRKLASIESDENRPHAMMMQDGRLAENYERLIGTFFTDVYGKSESGVSWENKNLKALNDIFEAVLDITISSLGNPVEGKGSLYFKKGAAKDFPYENLSAGEKEVVDLILDLYVKKDVYTKSVICIDEPELHLNTAIQRRMLREIEKLVSDTSQLWVATHSIGFLRALQEDLSGQAVVIDFTGVNFDEPAILRPIAGTRSDWLRIFQTALEDLTGLLAPKRIVYCEGQATPTRTGAEQGLDALVYNIVFEAKRPDTLFVSSGGGGAVLKNAALALNVLRKALGGVDLFLLKDQDQLSDADRLSFLAKEPTHRMLLRHEIENYLFDKEVLKAFCTAKGTTFDESKYDSLVQSIRTDDLKLVQQKIQNACGASGSIADFKLDLGKLINPSMAIYAELEKAIF